MFVSGEECFGLMYLLNEKSCFTLKYKWSILYTKSFYCCRLLLFLFLLVSFFWINKTDIYFSFWRKHFKLRINTVAVFYIPLKSGCMFLLSRRNRIVRLVLVRIWVNVICLYITMICVYPNSCDNWYFLFLLEFSSLQSKLYRLFVCLGIVYILCVRIKRVCLYLKFEFFNCFRNRSRIFTYIYSIL